MNLGSLGAGCWGWVSAAAAPVPPTPSLPASPLFIIPGPQGTCPRRLLSKRGERESVRGCALRLWGGTPKICPPLPSFWGDAWVPSHPQESAGLAPRLRSAPQPKHGRRWLQHNWATFPSHLGRPRAHQVSPSRRLRHLIWPSGGHFKVGTRQKGGPKLEHLGGG